MKIYTRKGDGGETSIIGKTRLLKDELQIEVYGTIDELNSVLGIVNAHNQNIETTEIITTIQKNLIDISTVIATVSEKLNSEVLHNLEKLTSSIETIIDEYDSNLPELRSFVIPGGTKSAAFCHQARTICRRAERLTVSLIKEQPIYKVVVQYLNRLSDLLFVLARYFNHIEKHSDLTFSGDER